jgi:hypothetical protein
MSAALNNGVAFDTPLLERNSRLRTSRSTLPLRSDEDVVGLRKHVRERAVAIALSLVDQTKLVTAASELARNTIKSISTCSKTGSGAVSACSSSTPGPAFRISTRRCATVSRPAAAWASAWAAPGVSSTSSTSIPVRERARPCLSSNGNADQFAVTAARLPDQSRQ